MPPCQSSAATFTTRGQRGHRNRSRLDGYPFGGSRSCFSFKIGALPRRKPMTGLGLTGSPAWCDWRSPRTTVFAGIGLRLGDPYLGDHHSARDGSHPRCQTPNPTRSATHATKVTEMERDPTRGGDRAAARDLRRLRVVRDEAAQPPFAAFAHDAGGPQRRQRPQNDARGSLSSGNLFASRHEQQVMHSAQRFAQQSPPSNAAGQMAGRPAGGPGDVAGGRQGHPGAGYPPQGPSAGMHRAAPMQPRIGEGHPIYPTNFNAALAPMQHAHGQPVGHHATDDLALANNRRIMEGREANRLAPLRMPEQSMSPAAQAAAALPVPPVTGPHPRQVIDKMQHEQLGLSQNNSIAPVSHRLKRPENWQLAPSNGQPGPSHRGQMHSVDYRPSRTPPQPKPVMHPFFTRRASASPPQLEQSPSRPAGGQFASAVAVSAYPQQSTRLEEQMMVQRHTPAIGGVNEQRMMPIAEYGPSSSGHPQPILPTMQLQQPRLPSIDGIHQPRRFTSIADWDASSAMDPEPKRAAPPNVLFPDDEGQTMHPTAHMNGQTQAVPMHFLHGATQQAPVPEPMISTMYPMQPRTLLPGQRTPDRIIPDGAPGGRTEAPQPSGSVPLDLPLRSSAAPRLARVAGRGRSRTAAKQELKEEDEIQPGPLPSSTKSRKRSRETRAGKSGTAVTSPPKSRPKKKSKSSTKKKSSSSKRTTLKSLNPPHTYFDEPTEGENVCAFCLILGDQRAVEGELLGPFKLGSKTFYAHRNCLYWAPEVYEEDGVLKGVSNAYKRAMARNVYCRICNGDGPTLCCQKSNQSCCRPMHFRCAIQKGAKLSIYGGSIQTMCPLHDTNEDKVNPGPIPKVNLFVQTPVPQALLKSDAVVRCCEAQNYHLDLGTLLHCGKCGVLEHSACILPDGFENFYGTWGALSGEGKYACKDCVGCDVCGESFGNEVNNERVTCVHCKHRSVHSSCAGDGVKDGVWRCDLCRFCRHCLEYVHDVAEWVEEREACRKCDEAHDNGVICPSCTRVYRDDLDSAMIQCDGCDEWLHLTPECTFLSDEEIERVTDPDLDIPYYCKPCQDAGRVPPQPAPETKRSKKRKRSKKSKRGTPDRDTSTVSEETLDLTFLNDDLDETGATVFFHYAIARRPLLTWDDGVPIDNAAKAMPGLAPGTDMCSLCGSGGPPESFRYCSDCGDAYHGFCLEEKLPELCCGPFISEKTGSVYRLSAGGTGKDASAWRCFSCVKCKNCSRGILGGGSLQIILCDHCGRGVHLECCSPPLEEVPKGAFKCDECDFCEMCGVKEMDTILIDEHLFCKPCSAIVRGAQKCVVCCETYPKVNPASVVTTSTPPVSITPDGDGEREAAAPVDGPNAEQFHAGNEENASNENIGSNAENANDAENDIVDVTGGDVLMQPVVPDPRYVVPRRRFPTGAKCASCGSVVHALCDSVVSSDPNYRCPKCRDPIKFAKEHPVVEEPMDEWSPLSGNNDEDEEGAAMGDVPAANPEGDNEVELVIVPPNKWFADDVDRRKCAFCKRPEICQGLHKLDRLIPFRSDPKVPSPVNWVHIGCAYFAWNVTRFTESTGTVTLAGRLQSLFSRVHAPRCSVCKEAGASVMCCHEGCGRLFHLHCAMDCGVCLSRVDKDGDSEERFYCQAHCAGKQNLTPLSDAYKEVCFSRNYRGAATRANAFSMANRPVSKTAQKCLIRVGGLSVMNLGHHVPHCAEFIVCGCMVPTNYRATRNYWSMKNKGERTLLHLEVHGDDGSGPIFKVWAADDPETVLTHRCPNKLWRIMEKRVGRRNLEDLIRPHERECSGPLTADPTLGLAMFGFAGCPPIVRMIERMPLAWLHKHRYSFEFGKPEANNPKSLKFTKGMGILLTKPFTGTRDYAARTDGYVATNSKEANGGPQIKKVHTGELYQLGVVMELEGVPQYAPMVFGMIGTTSTSVAAEAERLTGRRKTNLIKQEEERERKTIVLQSRIAGLGVYAQQDYKKGEVVMEYVGELIRKTVDDPREMKYDAEGTGCYMFTLPDGQIIDATKAGNAARFINHSCDPNTYSKALKKRDGKWAMFIVAKYDTFKGRELQYDYMFEYAHETPHDDTVLKCECGAANCRGFMN